MLRNTQSGYGAVSIAFHWTMALLLAALIIVGKYMHGLPLSDPNKFVLYQLHKSFGLTALALVFLRFFWRARNTVPVMPVLMPMWQKLGAHGVHIALYGLMLLIPLSGWLMVSASPLNLPTVYFNLFTVPHLPVPGLLGEPQAATDLLAEIHELLANLMIVVVIAHVAAALKHHMIDRDDTLRRMVSTVPARANNKG
ncbi:MAG: cytochrome B [Hyphomicrobiales bacterium]|mgnify:CR=1 FL=1|nr:MAG: cytochrome B [Hyphomicrobiales bacterium]